VFPFTSGGPADNEFRQFQPRLQESLGQQFLFDFRLGAASAIGTGYVAKATPDGYTLLLHNAGFAVHPNFYPDLPYDIQKSFDPVSQLSGGSTIVMVSVAALPTVHSIQDLTAWGRANPDKLHCNTAGQGGVTHILCAALSGAIGVPITPVHYKGVSQGQIDLIAGRTQVSVGTLFAALSNIRAGKIRPIAAANPERSKTFPDLRTTFEQGIDVEYPNWHALFAPAGTPPAIVNRLYSEIARVARMPEVSAALEKLGTSAVGSTPDEFRKRLAVEIARWRKVIQERGITAAE
jgi:tripartite-type tricarboxylate transporter receptor subunit TctC